MNTCAINFRQHFVDFGNSQVSIYPIYPMSLLPRLRVAESTGRD